MSEIKKKRTRKQTIIINILIILCVAVMLFSAYMLYNILSEYARGQNFYSGLAGPERIIAKTSAPANEDEEGETAHETEKAPDLFDFTELTAINSDVAAWIRSEGTVIDYPVVHGMDNEYYLKRLFNRTYNGSGSIFIDAGNLENFGNTNTVIHGHHMRNGSMFASLSKYKKQDYYEQHPTMLLYTPDANYRLDLFSGYVANYQDECYQFEFAGAAAYEKFLSNAVKKSAFKTDVEVESSDKIVTLSTCTYEYDDARFVVHAKLVKLD